MPSKRAIPSAPTGAGETDLRRLIESMEPELDEAEYVFATAGDRPEALASLDPWAVVKEREGTTLVLERPRAAAAGLPGAPSFRRITLNVHSSLEAVGLTAAVSAALARAGISANVIAAFYHDHVFVPASRAEEALEILRDLAKGARPRAR
jgi:uncharacterized protein